MIKSNCLDQIRSLQVKIILLENRMSPLAAMTSQSLGLKQACVTAQFLPTPRTSKMLGIWRNAGTRLTSFWMRSRPRCSTTRCALNTLRNSLLHTISSHISSYAANACQLKTYKKTTTKSTLVWSIASWNESSGQGRWSGTDALISSSRPSTSRECPSRPERI